MESDHANFTIMIKNAALSCNTEQILIFSFSAVRPNLDKYVFLQVNESTDGVLVEEETLDTGYVP